MGARRAISATGGVWVARADKDADARVLAMTPLFHSGGASQWWKTEGGAAMIKDAVPPII
jgi:hypothetical protein